MEWTTKASNKWIPEVKGNNMNWSTYSKYPGKGKKREYGYRMHKMKMENHNEY